MSNDLLGRITQTFEKLLKNVNIKATSYEDVNDYAVALGEILTTAFNIHITENPREIIEQILNDRLKENHRLITDFGRMVQDILNKQAKIGLEAQIPEVNQSRIDGLVGKITEKDFEQSKWLLGSPIVNFNQSVVDDMVRKNAEFHFRSGMNPKIIRKEAGNCCKWCKNLVGTYKYPDVPKDVYRRHRNCRCTVEYIPKKGIRQDVHTKKVKYETKEEVKELPYVSVTNEWLKSFSSKAKVLEQTFWEENGVRYTLDDPNVNLNPSKSEYHVARWITKNLGKDITLVPTVSGKYVGVRTPDYLINGERFDLKELEGNGKNTVDTRVHKSKGQTENFIFELSKTDMSIEEFKRQLYDVYLLKKRKINTSIVIKDDKLIDIWQKKE